MTEALCFGQIVDDVAKLLFTSLEALIEALKLNSCLVENLGQMSEFVSASYRDLVTKFAACESRGSINQRSQGTSDALSDTESQQSRSDYCQATHEREDDQRLSLGALNLSSGIRTLVLQITTSGTHENRTQVLQDLDR